MKKLFSFLLILSLALTVAFAEDAGTEKDPVIFTVEEIYQAGVAASDEQDYAKAAAYYALAAERGFAKAQNNLAWLYEKGLGVEQSYEKSFEYYQKAADQGLAEAQFNLALEYEEGHGVEQDYGKALEYYQLAAAQGHAEALNNIGCFYENARGVEQDYDKALVNFSRFSDANADLVLSSMKAKEDYLESEMQLKYNVYTAMSTQMQSAGAKLQEATPAFTVIQSASMPVKAAGPKRMLIAIAMTILVAIGLTAKILLKK